MPDEQRIGADVRVCPRCGQATVEHTFCPQCGLNLSAQAEVPTRSEWEARQSTPPRGAEQASVPPDSPGPVVPQPSDKAAPAPKRGIVTLDDAKAAFRCPKCGSGMIDFRQRGVSEWRGIAAFDLVSLVAPSWALAAGFVAATDDRKEPQFRCLQCGHSDKLTRALAKNGERTLTLETGGSISLTLRDGKREGDYTRSFAGGQLEERGCFRGDAVDGIVERFYESGAKRSRLPYTQGKRNGEVTSYYESGGVQEIGHYVDDQPHGIVEQFYESGAPRTVVPYEHGKPHGDSVSYYESGQVKARAAHVDGQLHGQLQNWNAEGELTIDQEYRDGKPVVPSLDATTLVQHNLSFEQVTAYQHAIKPLAEQIVAAYIVAIETATASPDHHLVVIVRKPKVTDLRRRLNEYSQGLLKVAKDLDWPDKEQLSLRALSPNRGGQQSLESRLAHITSLPGSQFWPRADP